jgi:hypothetical protein
MKRGGKTSEAHNVLWLLLPMLVEWVFKTGIYVIYKLPNHPMSLFIKGRIKFLVIGIWCGLRKNVYGWTCYAGPMTREKSETIPKRDLMSARRRLRSCGEGSMS